MLQIFVSGAALIQDVKNDRLPTVDFSILSQIAAANSNGELDVDEKKLGGYRPLYPPYFTVQTAKPSEQHIYWDQEYYNRQI
uniref:Uncharacterized protein n=1 Tax=Trichogramma kaykai TaxID=54128 RepID=A0ABD2W1Y9_9HYME